MFLIITIGSHHVRYIYIYSEWESFDLKSSSKGVILLNNLIQMINFINLILRHSLYHFKSNKKRYNFIIYKRKLNSVSNIIKKLSTNLICDITFFCSNQLLLVIIFDLSILFRDKTCVI